MYVKQILFLIAVICTVFPPPHLLAEPIVDIETTYYSVSENSADAIRNDINAKTPVFSDGKKFDAHTTWHVTWKFWWNNDGTQCEITKATTKVNIKFIYPELTSASSLSNPLRNKWEDYQKALIHHENGHKNFGIHAAREIEHLILNMGPRSNCKDLEIETNQIGKKIISKYTQREKDYDKRTKHGVLEGAVFP